jgi:hypothetical protein
MISVCTFLIYCLILLRMKNILGRGCKENQITHIMFTNFFSLENCVVCEIIWKNVVEPDRPQMTV